MPPLQTTLPATNLLKYRLRDIQGLVTAVVDVCSIPREYTVREVQCHIGRDVLQQYGSTVISKLISIEHRMRDAASRAVKVKACLVVLKAAFYGVDPGIAVPQHGSLPAGEAAIFYPQPSGSGDAHATVSNKINVLDIGDLGISRCRPDGIGKDSPISYVTLAAIEVDRPPLHHQAALVGHCRQVNIDHGVRLNGLSDLIYQGLELSRKDSLTLA